MKINILNKNYKSIYMTVNISLLVIFSKFLKYFYNLFQNSKLNNIHSLARPSYVVKRKTSYSKQSLMTIAFTCTVRSKYGLL